MNARLGPMAPSTHDTAKIERMDKFRVADFLRLLDEFRLLRSRSYNQDLTRMEEQHQQALETAGKEAGKRARSGSPEEVQRLQQEARRFVDAEHERTKEMLASKFQKLDAGLLSLTQFLKELGPIKEVEARLSSTEDRLKKEQDELNVQRKVIGREQEEFDHDKELIRTSQLALKEKQKELDTKLANLDVVKRAKELDLLRDELEGKLKAFGEEESKLEHDRTQLNLDFDKLGEQRAELEKTEERLVAERKELNRAKTSMADVVAKEMALTFESFVRDMLKPQEKQPSGQ
jgi:chromosome segregation ATPase